MRSPDRTSCVRLVDGNCDRTGGIETLNRDLVLRSDKMISIERVSLSKAIRFLLKDKNSNVDLIFDLSITWRRLPAIFLIRLLLKLRRWMSGAEEMFIIREHHYSSAFVEHNVKNRRRFETLLRLAYLCSDKVAAVSKGQQRWMESRHLIAPTKLSVVRHSPDLSRYAAIPFPDTAQPLCFGAFGRWTRQKGFADLLEAWSELSGHGDLRLLVGGHGPEEKKLRSISSKLTNVTLRPESDPLLFVSKCHCIIIPSRWEPFGLVCLEARAAGRPVLVANVDGLPEQVRDPECGIVYANNHPAALIQAIREVQNLFIREPVAYRMWCDNARRGALERMGQYRSDITSLLRIKVSQA